MSDRVYVLVCCVLHRIAFPVVSEVGGWHLSDLRAKEVRKEVRKTVASG